jgi:membrane-associated protein
VLPGVDLEQLLITFGYVGLFGIIFAESGLLFGFFLPGDSLLITAGVLSVDPPGVFSLPVVIVGCFIAAVTGDAVGYWTGSRFGRRLYDRPDSRFFKRSHLFAAEAFYERHGGKTIVIARFLPFVRTFAPVVAGIADMHYRRFAVYNFVGAALWAIGLPIAGYALGSIIPPETLDKYLLFILGGVVLLSVAPTAIHVARANREEIAARVRSRGRVGAVRPEALGDERHEA